MVRSLMCRCRPTRELVRPIATGGTHDGPDAIRRHRFATASGRGEVGTPEAEAEACRPHASATPKAFWVDCPHAGADRLHHRRLSRKVADRPMTTDLRNDQA